MERDVLKALVREVVVSMLQKETLIPIGVSNHHIHLTEEDYQALFPNEPIRVKKMLKQPGEFAAEQTVTVIGPGGEIHSVRILGPFRKHSQLELSKTDARLLGLQVPIRLSGDIENSPGIIVQSEQGELRLDQGVIIAKRHIHMSPADAKRMEVIDGAEVAVQVHSKNRSVVFEDCTVRVGPRFALEMHLDTDEANAGDISGNAFGKLVVKR